MARSEGLGSFGEGLSTRERGAAMAGALLAFARRQPTARGRVDIPDSWLRHQFPPKDAPESRDQWRLAVDAWRHDVQHLARARGIAIGLGRPIQREPWIDLVEIGTMIAKGSGVSAVHHVTGAARPASTWLWPLDLAFFGDADSAALRADLAALKWSRFVSAVSAEHATAPIEIVVLPCGLGDARKQFVAHLPQIQVVLVLGGRAGIRDPIDAAERLRLHAGADAVCIADVPREKRVAFLDKLLEELSHDLDFDVAFSAACIDARVKPPLMVAAEGAFARAHLSQWGRNVGVRVAETPRITAHATMARHASRPASEVGRELLEGIPNFRFESERHEASVIAELGHATKAEPPEPKRRPRFLQAELLTKGPELRKVANGPIAPGSYNVNVWIGEPEAGSIIAPQAFPDDQLAPETPHVLTVVLTTASMPTQPQVKTIDLPPHGASTRATFRLSVPDSIRRLEARITVLYENRVLQTVLLAADVGAGAPSKLSLFTLEGVVRRDLGGMVGRRPFDLALIANKMDGRPSVSVFAGKRASLVSASPSYLQCTKEVSASLADATNAARKYGAPNTAGTATLLADLARKGVMLRDAIYGMARVREAEISKAKRIQIIIARADENALPLEICYDGPGPRHGATTCPQWKAALEAGACQPGCPSDRGSVVCPVAFWGLSRVIERHAYSKKDAIKLGAADYALQSEPSGGRARLKLTNGVLCAAAAAARAADKDSVDKAFVDAGKLSKPSTEVEAWGKWRAAIAQNPSVLVLLAHSDSERGNRTLVIGKQDAEFIASVDSTMVGTGSGQGPIVLLLGCSTATTDAAFQSVVARFSLAGASIVVGTLCEILGEHAAPIASEILGELAQAASSAEGTPLGDLVPALRRRLLARGYPIVMAVAPYGDADWQI